MNYSSDFLIMFSVEAVNWNSSYIVQQTFLYAITYKEPVIFKLGHSFENTTKKKEKKNKQNTILQVI